MVVGDHMYVIAFVFGYSLAIDDVTQKGKEDLLNWHFSWFIVNPAFWMASEWLLNGCSESLIMFFLIFPEYQDIINVTNNPWDTI